MTTSNTIVLAKKALRKHMSNLLRQIPAEEVKRQSLITCNKLLMSPEFASSRRISVYLSMEAAELQTTAILENIFETKRECFVPRYSKETMEMVRLHSMDDYKTLPETKWKIKQPALGEEREDALISGGLDLVICPGVAFTRSGLRLGHGAGYYDKYLTGLIKSMKSGKRPIIIGLALKEQMVDSLPTSEFDLPMDRVIYDDSV